MGLWEPNLGNGTVPQGGGSLTCSSDWKPAPEQWESGIWNPPELELGAQQWEEKGGRVRWCREGLWNGSPGTKLRILGNEGVLRASRSLTCSDWCGLLLSLVS